MSVVPPLRVFKTVWFSKAAKKARIGDPALCEALRQVVTGQADDLGGGVYKKRLNDNMHRCVLLGKGGRYWVFEYLFAKKDRASIGDDELAAFRSLAKSYVGLTRLQIDTAIYSHFVAINVALGASVGDDRVTCFMPAHASVTVLETNGRAVSLVELGQTAETKVT